MLMNITFLQTVELPSDPTLIISTNIFTLFSFQCPILRREQLAALVSPAVKQLYLAYTILDVSLRLFGPKFLQKHALF